MKKPTRRQLEALKYIVFSIRDRGVPPTLRELSDDLGITHHYATRCLMDALNKKGYLSYLAGRSRGVVVHWEAVRDLGLPYPEWKQDDHASLSSLT